MRRGSLFCSSGATSEIDQLHKFGLVRTCEEDFLLVQEPGALVCIKILGTLELVAAPEEVQPCTVFNKKDSICTSPVANRTTTITATLKDTEPGTYQVDFIITNYDTSAAGHTHGEVSQASRGALDASCMITIPEGSFEGECQVMFVADQVSGVVTIEGMVQAGQDTATADVKVTVKVDGLVEFSGPWFSGLRSPDENHKNDVAFYLEPAVVPKIEEMLKDWQKNRGITSSTPTLVLSLNDMSLPWGGVFDLNLNWKQPHNAHRIGQSVDINRKERNLLTGEDNSLGTGCETAQSEECDEFREAVSDVCEAANNGKFHKLVNDLNWHCRFR